MQRAWPRIAVPIVKIGWFSPVWVDPYVVVTENTAAIANEGSDSDRGPAQQSLQMLFGIVGGGAASLLDIDTVWTPLAGGQAPLVVVEANDIGVRILPIPLSAEDYVDGTLSITCSIDGEPCFGRLEVTWLQTGAGSAYQGVQWGWYAS